MLSLILGAGLCGASAGAPFPGQKTAWNGYDLYSFTVADRACRVVTPKETAAGKPWIWRARFFGHEPQTDVALLGKGFHLVYCDVADLYGSPMAVAIWDAFYEYLTTKHGFARRVALEGMSRGGLIVYNWAAKNPDKVSCIYADAPVCDIKSWPGPGKWAACCKAYGITEEEARSFKGNPVDNLAPLAKAGVPLLHVCGGADTVVPVAENTAVMQKRYGALGGEITVILKAGVGHHPHSLKEPDRIVSFILHHTVSPEFRCHTFSGGADGFLKYRLLRPQDYDPSHRYPLVLFLHGAGERGLENRKQLKHVVSIFAEPANLKRYPCFVLVPQCPSGRQWVEVPWGALRHSQPEKPSQPMVLTLQVLSRLQNQFSIDSARLYVMGLSMGGYGTWDIICRHPAMFAAAVPVCGGGDEAKAPLIARLPVWNFHGGRDGVVKTIRSRAMIEAIKKAGGTPRYTEYPGVGHNCWTPASKEPELLPWLFGQKRSE